MPSSTVKLIIIAEVAGQRYDLGKAKFPIGEKLDEALYQGLQDMGTALYRAIFQGVDDGLCATTLS
jgi:hypothetical protein